MEFNCIHHVGGSVRYAPSCQQTTQAFPSSTILGLNTSKSAVVSREFPDRHRFILSKGQRPHCLVYWWTHQKRYNLTLWRMFEIQDVDRANIYPSSEYILLAGIFDRPLSPAAGASCALTVSLFLPPSHSLYICALCVCVQLGW